MALTTDEVQALRFLIREEIRTELATMHEQLRSFRDETNTNFDALFKRDETHQQQYLALSHQVQQLEKKSA